MKRKREEAERWLKQAEYDHAAAAENLRNKIYSYACFICEQAAQKALKAYLIFEGERNIWEHSIQKLAEKCSKYSNDFVKFKRYGAILDKYYLTSRYPDAVAAPALPYESYTRKEATAAVGFAGEITAVVREKLK